MWWTSPSGTVRNVTPEKFRGHTNWVAWQDDRTLLCRSGEGVDVTLATVRPDGTDREVILSSAHTGYHLRFGVELARCEGDGVRRTIRLMSG